MKTEELLQQYVELILGPAGLDELDIPLLVSVVSEDTADPVAEAVAARIRRAGGFARITRPGQPHGFDREPDGFLPSVLLLKDPGLTAADSSCPPAGMFRDGRWPAKQTVAPRPNRAWAGSLWEGPDAMEKLWTAIAFACRLDEDEPTGAWHRRHGELQRRAELLQSLQLDALRFVDERTGTDLKVGLLDDSRWQNGRALTQSGARFVPNVPCEEIHTAPDPQRVEGVAMASRPLGIGGRVVEGVRAEFVAGAAHLVEPDERLAVALSGPGRRLGEVALVDGESRVGQTGEVFGETLLDANAACHIAFGCPIPGSYGPGANSVANASALHLDLVIGTPTTSVMGITRDGQEISLLREGAWQLGEDEGWDDPDRIDRIIDALAIAWAARAEQRLGQLFRNAVPVLDDFELETVTDERVCRALESQATAVVRGRARSAADVANQERLIAALRDRWQAEPELRLGQLLRRIARGGGQYGDAGVARMSDEGWLIGLRR